MSDLHTLSIVLPALNEEDGIEAILKRILAIKSSLAEVGINNLELIVVDDGSKDQTSTIVKNCEQARLIQHPVNRGYGAALKTGFNAATGGLLAFLDADGTYPPEYFPSLCTAVSAGADLAVGSRRSGSSSEMPLVRRIGNLLWANLVTILTGQRVVDPASGMRVFRAEVLEKLYPLPDGLNFTPVMSTRAVHEGIRLVEVPIPYKERQGQSKLNVVEDGFRFLQTIIWTALSYNPVRILGGIGFIAVLISGIILAGVIGLRISGVTTLNPIGVAALFTGVVLGISGVDLFALGVTFNYLVSLFHKRPVRSGLFRKPIFKTPLENHFGWMGLVLLAAGLAIGGISLGLALGGWPIVRLWLYLLGGMMLTLLGIQLIVFWIIVQVLNELSQREIQAQNDLQAK